METINLNEFDSINYLVEQRNVVIEQLNVVLKVNDSMIEKKSLELLDNIFKINSQIKLEEDALIVKQLTENDAL